MKQKPPTRLLRVDARFAAHVMTLANRRGLSIADYTRRWVRRLTRKERTP